MVKQSKRKEFRVEQYYAIRQIFGMSLSPDRKTAAYITNTDGLPNIWTIPIEGGWTSQVTLQENAVKAISYSPKKNEIIFHSDFNGDENTQLYLISDKGGEPKNLTPEHTGAQVMLCGFNKSGSKILFASNKRDPRYFDSYVLELKSGNAGRLEQG